MPLVTGCYPQGRQNYSPKCLNLGARMGPKISQKLNLLHFCRLWYFVSNHTLIIVGVEGTKRRREEGWAGTELAVQDVSAIYEEGWTRTDDIWSWIIRCLPTIHVTVQKQCLSFRRKYSPIEQWTYTVIGTSTRPESIFNQVIFNLAVWCIG